MMKHLKFSAKYVREGCIVWVREVANMLQGIIPLYIKKRKIIFYF